MDTFWGCDPLDMDEYIESIDERIELLRDLIELLRGASASVDWTGPDAAAHRSRTTAVADDLGGACDLLAARRALLEGHRDAQERASSAEGGGDPYAMVRMDAFEGLRDLGGRLGPSTGAGLPDPGDLGPWIGGPLGHPIGSSGPDEPFDTHETLDRWRERAGETFEKIRPLLGGPLAAPIDPTFPSLPHDPTDGLPDPVPAPVPERGAVQDDTPFALDQDRITEASTNRKILFGQVPGLGGLQTAATLTESSGEFLDGVESRMESAGLGAATPIVGLARIPHDLAGVALGEGSVYDTVTGAVDQQFANVSQTSAEISESVGEGDWAGAARAGERGMLRHLGASADALTATSVPALSEAIGTVAGRGADVMDMASPGSGDALREAGEAMHGAGEAWQAKVDDITDTEEIYRYRLENAPFPWERRSA